MFEKTLLSCKSKNWNIADGYGKQYLHQSDNKKSNIFIYKLHGSINWQFVKRSNICGNTLPKRKWHIYEQLFNNTNPPSIHFYDPQRESLSFEDFIIEPSYIKTYDNFFTEIWTNAAMSIRKANEVFIIGCNLNEEDSALRMFLSAALLENKNANLTIVNYAENGNQQTELTKKFENIFEGKAIDFYWGGFEEWIKQK